MHEYVIKRLLIPIAVISILFLATPVSADTTWETNVISETGVDSPGGEISGNYIVYLGTEGFNQSMNRIYLYSIKTGEQEIVGTPGEEMTVTGEDISGNYAVWFETTTMDDQDEDEDKANRIYLYSIGEGSPKVLDLPGTAEWPKINGNEILYPDTNDSSAKVPLCLYDIATGRSETLTEISSDADTAGIVFDGENAAWQDEKGLYIYNIKSGERTTAFESIYGNETGSNVEDFDLEGDYLIYLKHTVNFEGADKGTYDLPCLYTISTGKTTLINPETGDYVSSPYAGEKDLSVTSPFTDGNRAGWVYSDNSPDSTIVLLDPAGNAKSMIRVNGTADEISMDGDRIVWSESHFPSFTSQLVYAEEKAGDSTGSTTAAPGFTALCCFIGISGAVATILVKRK